MVVKKLISLSLEKYQMARLSKEDWLAEGFKLLREFAQDKLRILYLCKRLGVTRGSFYHHFKGIEDYIAALMESWEQENTLRLIKSANKGQSPEERMEILAQMIADSDQTVEAAIRSWSFYHTKVKKHLSKVDELRITYVEEIFKDLGAEPELALKKAKLDYAVLVGVQQLFPDASRGELRSLWEVHKQSIME